MIKADSETLSMLSTRLVEGKSRVNSIKFKKLTEKKVIIFVTNGKNKDTGFQKQTSIMLDERQMMELKTWLNESV